MRERQEIMDSTLKGSLPATGDISFAVQQLHVAVEEVINKVNGPKNDEHRQTALAAAQRLLGAMQRPEEVVMKQAFEVPPNGHLTNIDITNEELSFRHTLTMYVFDWRLTCGFFMLWSKTTGSLFRQPSLQSNREQRNTLSVCRSSRVASLKLTRLEQFA